MEKTVTSLQQAVSQWLAAAEGKTASSGVTQADLQGLQQIVQQARPRQRLLYLHTRAPSITAAIIGMAQHEPVRGGCDTLRTRTDWPYETVHDAIVDGWQVIHFPNLMAPYDDRELSYVGYEFVLQKLEEVVNG
ncbi:MAG: hypothetical protein DYG89_22260 [Caldilinea sp. CFX5]|nr:hypothetical protein [Caldilinea sp. CFX5]